METSPPAAQAADSNVPAVTPAEPSVPAVAEAIAPAMGFDEPARPRPVSRSAWRSCRWRSPRS